MKILALNPFHGGSHRAFIEGWAAHSEHEFTILGLPGRKWKWRMRHAPLEFAKRIAELSEADSFDRLFTTDMLDLATLRGLMPQIASLPTVVYFHENQLTYPSRLAAADRERDLHFAFTNLLAAICADAVWFNSDWHRESFFEAAREWVEKLPDFQPVEAVSEAAAKSMTLYPGVDLIEPGSVREPGPLRIAWVSRWEFDKNPEAFFQSLRLLRKQGTPFRLSVLGEDYGKHPACFEQAREEFAAEIDRWGYVESRAEYEKTLRLCDVVVSTALHEFFGLAVVEAVSAGCQPLVPGTLAYPEVLRGIGGAFHDNRPEDLADRLAKLAVFLKQDGNLNRLRTLPRQVSRYGWPEVAPLLDRNMLLLRDNA